MGPPSEAGIVTDYIPAGGMGSSIPGLVRLWSGTWRGTGTERPHSPRTGTVRGEPAWLHRAGVVRTMQPALRTSRGTTTPGHSATRHLA